MNEYYITVGLNSNIKESDFQRKKLNLVIVLDVSGSMDSKFSSYLRSLKIFDERFLAYLKDFKFNGEIYAMREGSVVFAHEPLIRVKANIMEAQLMEAAILNTINFQTLIATKSSRMVRSAGNAPIMEFGLRRAQDKSAGIYGAKAAVVGGCVGTSNVIAAKKFGITPLGTHSHSWIQSFDSELDAFRAYAKIYPNNTLLLVDTYDTLASGIPNAIKVFKEIAANGDLSKVKPKEVKKKSDKEKDKKSRKYKSDDIRKKTISFNAWIHF